MQLVIIILTQISFLCSFYYDHDACYFYYFDYYYYYFTLIITITITIVFISISITIIIIIMIITRGAALVTLRQLSRFALGWRFAPTGLFLASHHLNSRPRLFQATPSLFQVIGIIIIIMLIVLIVCVLLIILLILLLHNYYCNYCYQYGNIPEHSSKADEDSGMQNVLGTFRNIPRTYRIGRTHPVLHLCSLSFRTDPIPSVILFIFFFPLSILLFSFVFFLRNRPYQADSTTSRPICEVKLPRARVVLRWGTTWEVRVLILLRLFNARSLVFHFIIII